MTISTEQKEMTTTTPKRIEFLRDYLKKPPAVDVSYYHFAKELLAALDERDHSIANLKQVVEVRSEQESKLARAEAVVEAARKAKRAMEVIRYEDSVRALFEALKAWDEEERT